LNSAVNRFNEISEKSAKQLNETLTQLETWNQIYMDHPPTVECEITKARLIRHNMATRNDFITYLICGIKSVSEHRSQVEQITKQILDITNFFECQFSDLDEAL